MSRYETQYQALRSGDDEDTEEDSPTHDADVLIHVVPERSKARWNHIENLDDFFYRVYHYHQRHGFWCMVAEDVFQLVQFVFVVFFSAFLLECVDYNILFGNGHYNGTHKVTIPEVVSPIEQCVKKFNFPIVICLITALVFWIFRFVKVAYNVFKYYEIRAFYLTALRITAEELPNMTWHEVQGRLLEVQMEQQMCIHKRELTQLDIYHRILRFKNYMIAMVNKSLLPLKFRVPFLGECCFLSTGLKYNLELIFFWGPWSPFENNWHLKDEYKAGHRRKHLAEELSKRILWIGIANLVLSPLIFLWQILYSFFRYAELIKRHPGILGSRRWSNYARLYVRHFNELDHEFIARLNRGYTPATLYMNIFTTPLLVIAAKNIAFFAASILAVLVVLTVLDEDVLQVEHILTTMTVAGLIVTGCRVLIPDEHAIYCPEVLMRNILAHVHYIPDHWKGNAHTYSVRDEFSLLFQYKIYYLLEELLSPFITPFILLFNLRNKSLEIVDFFRNFTVEVVGVGDVCSFAQMDIRKHGNPQWVVTPSLEVDVSQYQQAEDGKTELSLMHFHLTNPEWKPPDNCSMFINNIKEQAQRDVSSLSTLQPDMQPEMISQLPSLSTGLGPSGAGLGLGYNSFVSSIAMQSNLMPSTAMSSAQPRLRGGLSHIEGPINSTSGGFSSLHSSGSLPNSGHFQSLSRPMVDEGTRELMSNDMSFSALYMHDLRHRRLRGGGYESLDDIRARMLWQRQDSNQGTMAATVSLMPEIQESPQEEEKEGNTSAEGGDNITKSC